MGGDIVLCERRRRWRGFGAWLLVVVSALGATALPNPFAPEDVRVSTLPNGVRLVVREDHSLPLVAMVVAVRGGAAAEAAPRGQAHYLEHLVFQGTRKYPSPLAPQYALEQVGGVTNAVTGRDTTRFQATIASTHAELLVMVLADLVLAPSLRAESFAKERPVILAELQRESDNPLATALNRAYALTFRSHPYRYPPAGSIEDILRLSADDVRAFHTRWYVPNNLSVVLVGDVTPARARELVSAAFEGVPASPLPALPPTEAPSGPPPVRAHVLRESAVLTQALAFPAPGHTDFAGVVATDLVMTLLADGGDAVLPGWWAKDGVDVQTFGCEYISSRAPGRLLVWAQSAPAGAQRLRDSTIALMQHLAQTPLSESQLALVKGRLASQFLLQNETYSQQAATLAFYEGLGGAEQVTRYVPTLQQVGNDEIRRVLAGPLLGWVTVGPRVEED
jgi:zinc protease